MSKTIEILKFLRVSPEKKRLLQVRGKLFSSVDDIPDERVQHVVRKSIAEMIEMAGGIDRLIDTGYLEAPAVPLSEFLDEPEVTDVIKNKEAKSSIEPEATINELKIEEAKSEFNELSKPISTPIEAPLDKNVSNELENEITDNNTGDLNNGSLLSRFRNITGRKSDLPKSIIPKLDIAGQINDILQDKLETDRSYAGRQVELRSAHNGDLLFIVDGRSYDSVNDIQDEPVANLFRAAIAKWEQ